MFDRDGKLVTETKLLVEADGRITPHDITTNGSDQVAALVRSGGRWAGSGTSALPSHGQDHLLLIDGVTGSYKAVPLPEGVTSRVVRIDEQGTAAATLSDGRILLAGQDGATTTVTINDGIEIKSLDFRRDSSLIVATAAGEIWLVAPQAGDYRVSPVTTAVDEVEDVWAISWADQVITTDDLGSMHLWDIKSGQQLALLRRGPGVPDAAPVVDHAAELVWIPGTNNSLEAISTDPAQWAETLCRRTTRRLTKIERDTYIPNGLRAEEGQC